MTDRFRGFVFPGFASLPFIGEAFSPLRDCFRLAGRPVLCKRFGVKKTLYVSSFPRFAPRRSRLRKLQKNRRRRSSLTGLNAWPLPDFNNKYDDTML